MNHSAASSRVSAGIYKDHAASSGVLDRDEKIYCGLLAKKALNANRQL